MDFEEFRDKKVEDLAKTQDPISIIATCEAIKIEMILQFLDVKELLQMEMDKTRKI